MNPLQQLLEQPRSFSLLAALRLIENAATGKDAVTTVPRIGEGRQLADIPVRIAQLPAGDPASTDVEAVEGPAPHWRVTQHAFGMFGSHGALPQHISLLAQRRRHAGDETLVQFVNLLQQRHAELFYRAWADSQPTAPGGDLTRDRFRFYLGALIGLGGAAAQSRDAVDDGAKVGRVCYLGPAPRSAENLENLLQEYFGVSVKVCQLVAGWVRLPAEDLARLGRARRKSGAQPRASVLGSAMLGRRSWECQFRFELVLQVSDLATLRRFLPCGPAYRELHALVRLYTGDEWDWSLRLELPAIEACQTKLRRNNRLGWDAWVGRPTGTRASVRLAPRNAPPAAAVATAAHSRSIS